MLVNTSQRHKQDYNKGRQETSPEELTLDGLSKLQQRENSRAHKN